MHSCESNVFHCQKHGVREGHFVTNVRRERWFLLQRDLNEVLRCMYVPKVVLDDPGGDVRFVPDRLYLPRSDIDLVVIGRWKKLPLRTLGNELISQGIAEPMSVRVLNKASVPIVELTDHETQVKLDISTYSLVCSPRSPVLSKLVLVLKQILLQCDMNEVFTGGIST